MEIEELWKGLTVNNRRTMLEGSGMYPYMDKEFTVRKSWDEMTKEEKRAVKKAWKNYGDECKHEPQDLYSWYALDCGNEILVVACKKCHKILHGGVET